jgi:hypothetical protein
MQPATRWAIPDGWMPSGEAHGIEGHEAICVLNLGERDAALMITVLFEDREPETIGGLACAAARTRHFRLDHPQELNGYEWPFETPYAAVVDSDVPVLVQHTRVDTRGGGVALMTTLGVPLEGEGLPG